MKILSVIDRLAESTLPLILAALVLGCGRGISEEIVTSAIINSKASIEFSNCSAEMSERLAKWTDYSEPRRFLQHLQNQMAHASGMASKLGGMESLFELVSESPMKILALKQMHMHYADAYDDLSLRWETTRKIVEERPDLEYQIMLDVQAAIEPYMNDWVAPRLEAFETEIKKLEPEYSLDFEFSVSKADPSPGARYDRRVSEATAAAPADPARKSSPTGPVVPNPPASPPGPSSEVRTWESRDGKQLNGSFVRFVDTETIELEVGGRTFELEIAKLSDKDLVFLGEPPAPTEEVSAGPAEEEDPPSRIANRDVDPISPSRTTRDTGVDLRDLGIIDRPRSASPLGVPSAGHGYSPGEEARREMQRYQQHLNRTMAPRW